MSVAEVVEAVMAGAEAVDVIAVDLAEAETIAAVRVIRVLLSTLPTGGFARGASAFGYKTLKYESGTAAGTRGHY